MIIPAIKKLRLKNNKINGPFPADTIFTKSLSNKYDVIIGMYHDQVLSPIKALFNFDAINILKVYHLLASLQIMVQIIQCWVKIYLTQKA